MIRLRQLKVTDSCWWSVMLDKLNNLVLKIMGGESSLIKLQLIVGLFGIFYGIVAFVYFFFKISQTYAFIFLISIIIGCLLLDDGRKGVIHGKISFS